jgi:phosphatidate cytidylyltransferase
MEAGSRLEPARAQQPRFTNLQLRLMTAAVALPLLGAAIYAGGWPFAYVAGLVAVLAGLEFGQGWLLPGAPWGRSLSQLSVFAAPGVIVAGTHGDERFVAAGGVLALLSAAAGYAPTNALGPRKPWRVLAWAMVYVGLLMSTFVLLRDEEDGRDWFLLAVASTFAVDTGAYAVGRLVGRHLLAPRISPKKTWEGAVGGYAAGVGAFLGLNALLDTHASLLTMLPFALAMPVFAQVGDLFESWMKRRMGVKDASGLLPGHGGFLDRLDSLVFVVPALYVFLRLRVL